MYTAEKLNFCLYSYSSFVNLSCWFYLYGNNLIFLLIIIYKILCIILYSYLVQTRDKRFQN